MIVGLRYDLYGGSPNPTLNPNFVARYGFVNNSYVSGLGLLQPRLGLDWKPTSRIAVRGGAGVLAVALPTSMCRTAFRTRAS